MQTRFQNIATRVIQYTQRKLLEEKASIIKISAQRGYL
jgi:hypothetical protein